jgi:hypothetical protein
VMAFHRLVTAVQSTHRAGGTYDVGIPPVVVIAAARPNQMIKRYNRSELASTPCRGLSLSR